MPPQHQSEATAAVVDTKALLKELEQHNSFFDDLVDMIPAKLYVAGNSGKLFPFPCLQPNPSANYYYDL